MKEFVWIVAGLAFALVLFYFAHRKWGLSDIWVGVGVAVSIAVAILFGRRTRPDVPTKDQPKIDPERYDESDAQQLDAQADDLDADAARDARDLDDLAADNERLRAELGEL